MNSCKTLYKKLQITAQVLTTASVVGLITACTPTLNSEKLEADIQQWLEQEKSIDAESVSCPAQIKIEVGNTVECEANAEDGTQPTIAVKMDSEAGDVSLELDNDSDQNSSTALNTSDDSSSPDGESTDDPSTPDANSPEIDPNTPLVDIDFVESTLKKQFKEQTGISVQSVACPNRVAVEVNGKFDCSVKSTRGKTIEANVVQTNERGGFSWNSEKGLISFDKVEGLIKSGFRDQDNLSVTPKCGTSQTRYTIAYTGDTFNCTAKDPNGRSIPIRISVKTDYGQVLINWKR